MNNIHKHRSVLVMVMMTLGLSPLSASAVSLHEELRDMLNQHPGVKSARSIQRAADWDVESATDSYYPVFSISGESGRSRYEDPNTTFGSTERFDKTRVTYEVTQNLFRGFRDEAIVEQSKAERNIANAQANKFVQDKLYEGIVVYVDALREKELSNVVTNKVEITNKLLSIKKRARKSGSGTDIDILEASLGIQKALDEQLNSMAVLRQAAIQYAKLFNRPDLPEDMSKITIPERLIPDSEDKILEAVLSNNADVANAKLQMDVASSIKKGAAGEYFPTLDLVGTREYDRNSEGQEGASHENAVLLRMNWEFNLGNKTGANVSAATERFSSAQFDYDNVLREASQNARLAYARFQNINARQKLAKETLTIAQRIYNSRVDQKKAGKVDDTVVISAQTRMLAAKYTAITTYYDAVKAAYEIAYTAGTLTPENMNIAVSLK